MDLIWGALPQTAGKRPKPSKTDGGEDDDEDPATATPAKKGRNKDAVVGGSPLAPSSSPGAGSKLAGASILQLASPNATAAKLAKELDASEKVSLGITQMLKKVEDDAQIIAVTQKVFDSQMSKIESRLTPELSVLYTQGYDGTTATPGVRVYEELDRQRTKLKSIEGLIKNFSATEGEGSTADALFVEYKVARNAGVNIAPVVWTTVCARGFKECLDAQKYNECAEILDSSFNHEYGVSHMSSAEQAATLQSQLLLVNIVGLLKTGTEVPKEKTEELKVATHAAAGILSELIKAVTERGLAILDKVMDPDVKRMELIAAVACAKEPVSEETLAKAEARPCRR